MSHVKLYVKVDLMRPVAGTSFGFVYTVDIEMTSLLCSRIED